MRIAIIDDDPGQLQVFSDVIYSALKGVSVDFYDDATKFAQTDDGQYKVVIVDHRFNNGKEWKDVYNGLKNNPQVIVTMTYPPDYYKNEFPNLYYALTEEVTQYKSVSALQKKDHSALVRMIETEEIEERLLKNINKLHKYL